MAIDFSKLLSIESLARLAFERKETLRLYLLTDRFLAESILKMAREFVARTPDLKNYPDGYEHALFLDIAPEIARRLGAATFGHNERRDAEIIMLSNTALRNQTGYCLRNVGHRRSSSMLVREPIHGNPLCFALDRLAPPESIADDVIASSMTVPARARGVPFDGVWTPALNHYDGRSRASETSEADMAVATKPLASVSRLRI